MQNDCEKKCNLLLSLFLLLLYSSKNKRPLLNYCYIFVLVWERLLKRTFGYSKKNFGSKSGKKIKNVINYATFNMQRKIFLNK